MVFLGPWSRTCPGRPPALILAGVEFAMLFLLNCRLILLTTVVVINVTSNRARRGNRRIGTKRQHIRHRRHNLTLLPVHFSKNSLGRLKYSSRTADNYL